MVVSKKETRKRLNSTIFATHYSTNHKLDVSEGKETFEVHEKITLDVIKPTKAYTTHGKNIIIKSAVVIVDGEKTTIPLKNITSHDKQETITFNFSETIPAGTVYLDIDFVGKYHDVAGLYLSKYTGRDGKTAYIATTQFEAADARRAFVCEDEPLAKATYDIAITLDDKLKAISNMPEKETVRAGNGKKTVRFHTTPKMSSYLAYLAVGDFETKETKVGKTTLRVVALPGKIHQAAYALEAGKKLLQNKEQYYGIPYPLPKLDMLAVPDFSAGAMENWGAITFREDILLNDPKTSPASQKIKTISTISHELEHMWFGNLVTMQWWDDLWLNESFADVRAYNGVEATYPELDPWADLLSVRVANAYELDALTNSHPIHVPVHSPTEIREIFDAISYSKGGMILRMVEHLLGKEVYRKGLQSYLKKHSYANAEAKDLWNALEKVSDKPVGKIVDVWINKMGFPIVDVDVDEKKLKVSQRRFRYLGSDKKVVWKIPLSIVTNNDTIDAMLGKISATINLPTEPKWIKLNGGQFGFYRVKYSDKMLDGIKAAVATKQLNNFDRWGIHNDLSALCLAGEISLSKYLDFVMAAYKNEDDYLVLMDIFSMLQKIMIISFDESFSEKLKDRMKRFYTSLLERAGWDEKKGEKETQGTIRAAVISILGKLNDTSVLLKAKELLEKEAKAPGIINPNLRGVVYKLNAWQGDNITFDRLLDIRRKAITKNNLLEGREALEALGNFKDTVLLEKALDFGMSKEVKPSDFVFLALNVSANPYGKKKLWDWMRKNWRGVKKCYSGGLTSHFTKIMGTLPVIADAKIGKEIQSFIESDPIPGSERSVKQMEEVMRINSKFLERARKSM